MSKYRVLVVSTDQDEKEDLLEFAWGIIANAYSGNWKDASLEWQRAAEKWRDQYGELRPFSQDESM